MELALPVQARIGDIGQDGRMHSDLLNFLLRCRKRPDLGIGMNSIGLSAICHVGVAWQSLVQSTPGPLH